MLPTLLTLTIVVLAPLVPAMANADPCTPPKPVAQYLALHPGWRIETVVDLVPDDQKLWAQDHKGLCPGLAGVVLDASGKTSFALAVLANRGGKVSEQAIVLKPAGADFRTFVLQPPFKGRCCVVWRSPPGKSSDMDTGRAFDIPYDSVVWEEMESASQQFYFLRGKFHKLQTGD